MLYTHSTILQLNQLQNMYSELGLHPRSLCVGHTIIGADYIGIVGILKPNSEVLIGSTAASRPTLACCENTHTSVEPLCHSSAHGELEQVSTNKCQGFEHA